MGKRTDCEEVQDAWQYIHKFCLKWWSDNEMFKQFILSGFDSRGKFHYFHKNYFFKLRRRKLHNKIQDGVSYHDFTRCVLFNTLVTIIYMMGSY